MDLGSLLFVFVASILGLTINAVFLFSFLSHSDDNLNTKTKDYRCFTTNDFHYWCLKVYC